MTIILDIIYLPVLVQIMLAVVIGALYLLLGVPMIVWSLSVVGIMWLYSVDSVICWGIASVLAIFSVPMIRQYVVSWPILKAAQRFKIFPKVSSTERAALEAGTVWMDKELFSGTPCLKRLMI